MHLPLYQRLLGERFQILPAPVRDLHSVTGERHARGHARIRRGSSLSARLLARLISLPPAAESVPVSVTFLVQDGREHWLRSFGGKPMNSIQWQDGDRLMERLGPVVLVMRIDAAPEQLSLHLLEVRCLGLRLPRWLHPRVRAVETGIGGRFQFDVSAAMPGVGLVVHYQGELAHVEGG